MRRLVRAGLEHQQGPLADDATMLLTDGAAATSMTSHPYGLVRRPTVRGGVSARPRPSGGADSAGNPPSAASRTTGYREITWGQCDAELDRPRSLRTPAELSGVRA